MYFISFFKHITIYTRDVEAEVRSGSELGSIWLFEEPEAEVFFIKHGAGMWNRKLEAEAVRAVKFLWKRKHFEKRSWKRKQTWKRQTLYGARSGSQKYSTTTSTSLIYTLLIDVHILNSFMETQMDGSVWGFLQMAQWPEQILLLDGWKTKSP